ncbi:MAG: PfkB family carbohydrate kinase [Promethearchaeota archaeon]|jgi:sugar/nucleoside kinase (ribokinase family)
MSNQNKNYSSLFFIGHFAVDNVIRFKRLSKPTLGGSVSYCSLALRAYTQHVKISIISHVGTTNFDKTLFRIIRDKNIDLQGIKYSEVENTNFILDYFNHARTLTLKSKSPNLVFRDIPPEYLDNPPDLILLVPLCNEISYEYISQISKQFPNIYIGLDLQGFIRNIDEHGIVSHIYDEKIITNLTKIIDLIGDKLILKGSEEEMKLLANEYNDLEKVMMHFEKFGTNGIFIMTLGEKGSLIYQKGNKILRIPAFKPKKVIDETGAGDVYLSIFSFEFLHTDKSWGAIENIGYLASAAASFLVERKGPTGFVVKKKVLKRLKKKQYIS